MSVLGCPSKISRSVVKSVAIFVKMVSVGNTGIYVFKLLYPQSAESRCSFLRPQSTFKPFIFGEVCILSSKRYPGGLSQIIDQQWAAAIQRGVSQSNSLQLLEYITSVDRSDLENQTNLIQKHIEERKTEITKYGRLANLTILVLRLLSDSTDTIPLSLLREFANTSQNLSAFLRAHSFSPT